MHTYTHMHAYRHTHTHTYIHVQPKFAEDVEKVQQAHANFVKSCETGWLVWWDDRCTHPHSHPTPRTRSSSPHRCHVILAPPALTHHHLTHRDLNTPPAPSPSPSPPPPPPPSLTCSQRARWSASWCVPRATSRWWPWSPERWATDRSKPGQCRNGIGLEIILDHSTGIRNRSDAFAYCSKNDADQQLKNKSNEFYS